MESIKSPSSRLHGSRPARILLGYWKDSSEAETQDCHAVYGVLGKDDVFRLRVMKESRDGRPISGNFPGAPGACWVTIDRVILEPHIKLLKKSQLKEYCRVRQYQLDRIIETIDNKGENEKLAADAAVFRAASTPAYINRRYQWTRARPHIKINRNKKTQYDTIAACPSRLAIEYILASPQEENMDDDQPHDIKSLDDARVIDSKAYGNTTYLKRAGGLFAGMYASSGQIVNIAECEYVEYRVLTKPSFG